MPSAPTPELMLFGYEMPSIFHYRLPYWCKSGSFSSSLLAAILACRIPLPGTWQYKHVCTHFVQIPRRFSLRSGRRPATCLSYSLAYHLCTLLSMQRRVATRAHSTNASLSDPHSAVNVILAHRKCWRIMKGKNEPVWPRELEAALIEGKLPKYLRPVGTCSNLIWLGMERYKPTGSRSTKALGRLPMRNKFIADYIFEVTGKRRTPKQVGSRIQQLRDTNSGKHSQYSYRNADYSNSIIAVQLSRHSLTAITRCYSLHVRHTTLQMRVPPISPNGRLNRLSRPRLSTSTSKSHILTIPRSLTSFRSLHPRPLTSASSVGPFVTSIQRSHSYQRQSLTAILPSKSYSTTLW